MSVTYLNPEGIHKPVDNMYAHVAVATGTKIIRIGGQVAVDARGANVELENMAGQIRACYEMATVALRSCGATWKNVVHVSTYTTDIDAYMREEQAVVRRYFGDAPPPSTVVEVARLVDPAWLVEVQVDAII